MLDKSTTCQCRLQSLTVSLSLTYLQRVQHALPGHNDLFGLLLHGEGADEGSHLLGCLPLGQLAQSLLAGPHTGVYDLQEQLPRPRVEDENAAIDGLCRQVAFKRLGWWQRREYIVRHTAFPPQGTQMLGGALANYITTPVLFGSPLWTTN